MNRTTTILLVLLGISVIVNPKADVNGDYEAWDAEEEK